MIRRPRMAATTARRPGPRRLRTARGIDMHVGAVDTGPQQRIDLVIGVLVGGRDPRVAEEHVPETTGRQRWPTLILDPERSVGKREFIDTARSEPYREFPFRCSSQA